MCLRHLYDNNNPRSEHCGGAVTRIVLNQLEWRIVLCHNCGDSCGSTVGRPTLKMDTACITSSLPLCWIIVSTNFVILLVEGEIRLFGSQVWQDFPKVTVWRSISGTVH